MSALLLLLYDSVAQIHWHVFQLPNWVPKMGFNLPKWAGNTYPVPLARGAPAA